MPTEELGWSACLRVLETALAGRVLLAFLPAGWPGGHTPRELPATLLASLLLGSAVRALLEPWLASWLTPVHLRIAIGILLALRLVTLPGALPPRLGTPRGHGTGAAAAELAALLLAAGWVVTELAGPDPRTAPARLVGAGALFGVAWLRRAEQRAGILAALAFAVPAAWPAHQGVTLALLPLFGLVVFTAAPSRRWIFAWSAALFLLFSLAGRT